MPVAAPPASQLADAQAELETRIRRGTLQTAADLKAEFPLVWDDPEARLELVYSEFVLRAGNGEQPRREDWFDKYPELRDRLERLFGLYDLLNGGDTHRPAATVGPDRPTAAPPAAVDHPAGYEILGELGRGGMAVVYRARHHELNRVVALKVLRWGDWDTADDARRVRREAELVARLQHPHIVQVYEVGEWDGDPFLALEYVAGGTLADALGRLQKQGQTGVSTAEAVALVGVLAGAVQAAHEQGVVHRDLKPANVLLADDPTGPFARPKITDFGLAVSTEVSTAVTQTAALAGTPCYMAPEQADAKRAAVGPRTDVYALGGVLYELLTGRPPFQGATVLETLDLVRHTEPVSPRLLRPNLPRDLETICLKCLEKDPARRYESAAKLADDLARFRDGRPILARPVGAVEKAWKWVRRKPVLAGLAAALLLAVTLGVVGVTREYLRAEGERAKAVAAAANETQAKLNAQANEQRAITAAEKERDANALTAERLKEIDRVNNTLFDIFAEFDLARAKGDGVPIEKALARKLIEAGRKIDAAAIRDPLMLANLRNRLAATLINLGDPAAAIHLLEVAVVEQETRLGRDSEVTLGTFSNLAGAHLGASRLGTSRREMALQLLTEAHTRCKNALTPGHPLTIQCAANLAAEYTDDGRTDLSVPLLEEALTANKAARGPHDAQSLLCMNNLAVAYRAVGKKAESLELLEQTLAGCKVTHGLDNLYTLRAMGNLADAYRAAGRLKEALPLLEETATRMRATLGPDSPETLGSQNNLARGYQADKQLTRAEALFEETLARKKATFGLDNSITWVGMTNLGSAYRANGKPDRALPLYEEVFTRRRARLGPGHRDTQNSMNNLAVCAREAGQLERVVPLLEEAVSALKADAGGDAPPTLATLLLLGKVCCSVKQGAKGAAAFTEYITARRKQVPKNDPKYADELSTLALILLQTSQFAPGEAMFREYLTIRESVTPDYWITFNARSLLGAALLGQKKYADAEPLLVAGYEGMKAREKDIPKTGGSEECIPDALDRIIQLYTATNKPAEVKKYTELRAKYPAPKGKK